MIQLVKQLWFVVASRLGLQNWAEVFVCCVGFEITFQKSYWICSPNKSCWLVHNMHAPAFFDAVA